MALPSTGRIWRNLEVDGVEGRLLPAANQHPERRRGGAVADPHPVDRRVSGLPDPEERLADTPHLAQKGGRVGDHILVRFLAYVLWKTLGGMCKATGLSDEPRRVIGELGGIKMVDVVLPTRSGVAPTVDLTVDEGTGDTVGQAQTTAPYSSWRAGNVCRNSVRHLRCGRPESLGVV